MAIDAPFTNPTDGICYDGVLEGCTLREALEEAESASTPVTILFHSSLSNATITLTAGSLDWEASETTVDGGTNNITISGASLPAGQGVFRITGNHNLLENLSITGAKRSAVEIVGSSGRGNSNALNGLKIFGNSGGGVRIDATSGSGGDYNQIWNSHIGSNGSSLNCSEAVKNSGDGIYIIGLVHQTLITNNTIVCNSMDGIFMAGTYYTMIQNNYIGTDGTHSGLGNSWVGIESQEDTILNIYNNVISGNTDWGILMYLSSGTHIERNKIGTNSSGTAPIPNGEDGILMSYNSNNNVIGSPTDSSKRNIISGNGKCGVKLTDGAHFNTLNGNYIGLGEDGMTPIPNGEAGVAVVDANNNILGSSEEASLPQFISSNSREGVYVAQSFNTTIYKNTFIGVAADTVTARGNGAEGVKLDDGSTLSRVYPQKIAYNYGAGIAVVGNSAGNMLVPGFVGSNGGLPIDLGNDGHTPNGTHIPPGPNDWINYPIVTTHDINGLSGSTYAGATVHFYAPTGVPTASQGGGTYVGKVLADADTGAYNYTLPVGIGAVTMVACDTSYNCSEMSPGLTLRHSVFLPMLKR